MGTTNYGNSSIVYRYKHPAKAADFSILLKDIMSPGIYSGGLITNVGNNISVLPYNAMFISGGLTATKIVTTTPISYSTDLGLGDILSTKPYITASFTYSPAITNYADYAYKAFADLTSTDIIFGKGVFSGATLTSIDYSEATYGIQKDTTLNKWEFKGNVDVRDSLTLNGNPVNAKQIFDNVNTDTVYTAFTSDADIYCVGTADRTIDITAGASSIGTVLTINNKTSSTYKVTVTHAVGVTNVIYKDCINMYKWDGVKWNIILISHRNGIVSTSTNLTILDTDNTSIVEFDTTNNECTGTLPLIANNIGRKIKFILSKNDATLDKVIVKAHASDGSKMTGDALAEIWLVKQGDFIEVYASPTSENWEILGEALTAQLRLDTHAGYGSTDTKIPRFTNVLDNIGNLFTENHVSGYSGNTKGLEITIQKSGKYAFGFVKNCAGATEYLGFSLNSSQLTTSYRTITLSTKLGYSVIASGGFTSQTSYCLFLKKGDVVRPHTAGIAAADADSSQFIVSYMSK